MTTEIRLSRGRVALVDDEDAALVLANGPWHWAPTGNRVGYGRTNVKVDGRWTLTGMHNLILGAKYVDHVDGNGLNNTRANLRLSDPATNAANRFRRRDSKTGFKGVERAGNRWRARIVVRGERRELGCYTTPEAAARAYDAAAIQAWGEFARPNFPPTQEVPA